MLKINLLQKFGLINGSQGKIIDIIYRDGEGPNALPKAVIVDFPEYKGPKIFKDHPTYVPIVPFTATWNDPKHRCRKQIPLDLAWSITIHKSQGLTLDRAVIDIGKSENPLGGITFVAISRLRSLDGLYIQPMPWERLLQINKKVTIKQRIQEELRLFSL